MATSVNVSTYLKSMVDFSTNTLAELLNSVNDLNTTFYTVIDENYKLMAAGKPVTDYNNVEGKKTGRGEEKHIAPFIYTVPHYKFYSSQDVKDRQAKTISLVTTDYATMVDEIESAMNIINGKVIKAVQAFEEVRRKVDIVKNQVARLETVKEPNDNQVKMLKYCRAYIAVYKDALVWVDRISDPIEEIYVLLTKSDKLIRNIK